MLKQTIVTRTERQPFSCYGYGINQFFFSEQHAATVTEFIFKILLLILKDFSDQTSDQILSNAAVIIA